MILSTKRTALLGGSVVALLIAAGAGGYLIGHPSTPGAEAAQGNREILYWYDPMVPGEHHDGPGLSSMGMKLIPKYADEGAGEAPGVTIDPRAVQNLGARIATAQYGTLPSGITTTGTIAYNERDVAIVQARAGGFVERVYGLAPDDVVRAGTPIADVLVPEWGGAQQEYLALKRTGDAALARAARQRLVLLGMPAGQIAAVERSGRVHNVVTIRTPVGGVVKTLGVRQGMTLAPGQTLAEVNGLGTVWVNAAVPEAQAGAVRVGTPAEVTVTAFPEETFTGRVTAILPQADVESRTLTARIEIANRGGRLRPGMFATVAFQRQPETALLVPSEAIIRTGTRDLVMLAKPDGRYRPAEVRVGDSAGGQTEILAGLTAGEKVVASGQFLIDSEASLSGVEARSISEAPKTAGPSTAQSAGAYSTTGTIESIEPKSIKLAHEAVDALGWPAMTMAFRLGDRSMLRGFKRGDHVRFSFDQTKAGPTLRTIAREGAQ
jgi:Cu(I)/Ag(I) efflux system membrane fusion protein